MSDNASDIKSCLEYLEKYVDDEEVELIVYQEEEEDTLDDSNDHENCDGFGSDDVEIMFYNDEPEDTALTHDSAPNLPSSNLSTKETPKNSTSNSTHAPSKNRSSRGNMEILTDGNITDGDQALTVKIHQFTETQRNIDNLDDSYYSDETNDNDDPNYIEIETKAICMIPPKPLGRYQCIMCPYNSHFKSKLMHHLLTHSAERPYKCSVCEKTFKCKEYLKCHIDIHADIKSFQCVDCGKEFVSTSRLGYHKKIYHSNIKPVKCTECDYSTVDRSRLKAHKATHMDERPYQCSHCSYSSTNAVKLKCHMRVHTGEKPYECNMCHSRFTEANLLRLHRQRHFSNGKNVFQCNRCPSKLRTRNSLLGHMRKVHNEMTSNKPYKCSHCDRSYTLKACLLRHREIHDQTSKPNQEKFKLNV